MRTSRVWTLKETFASLYHKKCCTEFPGILKSFICSVAVILDISLLYTGAAYDLYLLEVFSYVDLVALESNELNCFPNPYKKVAHCPTSGFSRKKNVLCSLIEDQELRTYGSNGCLKKTCTQLFRAMVKMFLRGFHNLKVADLGVHDLWRKQTLTTESLWQPSQLSEATNTLSLSHILVRKWQQREQDYSAQDTILRTTTSKLSTRLVVSDDPNNLLRIEVSIQHTQAVEKPILWRCYHPEDCTNSTRESSLQLRQASKRFKASVQ